LFIHPDPGPLPTKAAPKRGEEIKFRVNGLPPFKELRASIRNPKHPHYSRFTKLRSAGIKAINGRCWYDDGISLDIRIYANDLDKGKKLSDYLGGIEDTLDGSHGVCFTYLPIVYQDDCQVCATKIELIGSVKAFYEINIKFL
jgi:hypothetical protein